MFLESNFNYDELKNLETFTYISPMTGEEDFINTKDINTLILSTEEIILYTKKRQQINIVNFVLNYKENEKVVNLKASTLVNEKAYEIIEEIDLKGFCDLLALGKNMNIVSINDIEKIQEIKKYMIDKLSFMLINNKILVLTKSFFVNGFVFSQNKKIGYFTNFIFILEYSLKPAIKINDYIGYLSLSTINNIRIEIETGETKISLIPTNISEKYVYFSEIEYIPNKITLEITKEDIKNHKKRMDLLDDPNKQEESTFELDDDFL